MCSCYSGCTSTVFLCLASRKGDYNHDDDDDDDEDDDEDNHCDDENDKKSRHDGRVVMLLMSMETVQRSTKS